MRFSLVRLSVGTTNSTSRFLAMSVSWPPTLHITCRATTHVS